MAKICEIEGCNEEIADWQNVCPRHFAMMQQQKQQSGMRQEYPQQHQPQQQQGYVPQQMAEQPMRMKQPQTEMPQQKPKVELPKLDERERLIVKQTSMKCAIDFLQQTPVEYQDYEEMMGQLERLTVDIYKIIVKRNEG